MWDKIIVDFEFWQLVNSTESYVFRIFTESVQMTMWEVGRESFPKALKRSESFQKLKSGLQRVFDAEFR